MTTLAELTTRVQTALADASAETWAAATIQSWIEEAIREYSIHFPRQRETTIACSDDVRQYDLPADFQDVVSAEYPDGEDPPEYLRRLSHHHPSYWQSSGYYDVFEPADPTDLAQIWISEKPSAGQDIALIYLADHDYDLDPADSLTVPDTHHHLLIQYVVWSAMRERMAAETANPQADTLILSQLASDANRAFRTYIEALNKARNAQAPGSYSTTWRMDVHDPIY